MNVITTFKDKRREKQITYERKMLRELSLEVLKKGVNEQFGSLFRNGMFARAIEDGCVDIAIEAYLVGSKYGKFGYHGESLEQVKNRCYFEEKYLTDTLFDFLTYWGQIGDNDFVNESLYYTCEHYVDQWWVEGFYKSEKRYRLRLH
ncbi:YbaK family protein [Cytobacillus sp. S13-E01]|uniref:YbaK family protein n=1 Tax=Cytobacillus sp. S13-E01 TaxID=3031326 RepID=UPI0023D86CBC|nr:YbaK family protein [Cytobacillus sp. S13-E01]MDF0727542.1 YbaK family protein [Cytobacillus sp. S13-E01]